MIKLKDLLNEESAMKAIINAKKGAKASGGGYSNWFKIGNNSWKNKKTGRLAHNAGLYDRIGEFSDFVIEGKLNEGNNLYDHVRQLKNSFSIFKQHSRDGYKQLDKAFNIRSIETLLGKMIKWMDTAPAMREGKLTEDAVTTFTKDMNGEGIKAKVYTATGDGKTVEAQFTNKKWPDGVPVTKNLTRGGYKSIKTPQGKFKVIETDKFFYYEINNGWAAVSRKRYTTPPFEY